MTESRVAVIAVGGNALISDSQHQSVADQFASVTASMTCVADLICDGWTVVLTHGNGPQVGFALRRSELAAAEIPPLPMDYADADTQGVIGYMLQRALGNELRRRDLSTPVVTVVTQVLVAGDDPSMTHPSKPIGAYLTQSEAEQIRARDGWSVAEDAGRGWRRVVASPRPREIVELEAIRTLVNAGHVVVACGGGGIPVVRSGAELCGTWAVVDKDLTASLLARELRVDLLLILTGVDRLATGFRTTTQEWHDRLSSGALRTMLDAGEFPAGSMEPKVRAVLEFVEAGGQRAIITDSEHLADAVAGRAGTTITSD